MSTTPTISDSPDTEGYTVVSGGPSGAAEFDGVSLVVLNRGGKPFKYDLLSSLSELKVREILSVETSRNLFEVEGMASRLPSLKFLLVPPETGIGERINIAVAEASGSHVLVFWNDMHLQIKNQAERIFKQALEGDFLCRVPLLMNAAKEAVPTRFAPGFSRRKLEVYPLTAVRNKMPTLYPYDYCGLYNKRKFLLSGGFDPALKNPYWQKLDYGFRAFLWGETIETGTAVKLNYLGDIPRENTTRDSCYSRFFLKNLALRFHGDSCTLPFSRFLAFQLQAGGRFWQTLKEYSQVKRWVDRNSFRFKTDPYNLTELWEME